MIANKLFRVEVWRAETFRREIANLCEKWYFWAEITVKPPPPIYLPTDTS